MKTYLTQETQCCGGLNKSETESNNSKLHHPDCYRKCLLAVGHLRFPYPWGQGGPLHLKHQELLFASQTHEWRP